MADALNILFEDNHLLAVDKPAGVRSAHFDGEVETLDRIVKAYLKTKFDKPGNVFLGIVHRLDQPTSGVMLFARTSKAAARLSEQFRDSTVEKIYWAVVEQKLDPPAGTFEDWLWKDPLGTKVQALAKNAPGAKRARTNYETRAVANGFSWLELRPQTGRTHQLRVQLSSRQRPIVGDIMYGSEQRFSDGIALHARSLTFQHPISREPMTLTAELPVSWRSKFPGLVVR